MKFLAVDTSLQATSVAIMEISPLRIKKILAVQYLDVELTHSETTQVLVENCLASANLQLQDIDYFVSVTGPGSFTGLRIGVTLVKTLAATQKKPCIAVDSLSSLAYEAATYLRCDKKTLLVPVLDARNERVFAEIIVANKIVEGIRGVAFADLLAFMQRKYVAKQYSLQLLSNQQLPYLYKYANALANFREFHFRQVELSAVQALDMVAERYVEHSIEFLAYNDLQPTYYALSQAERKQTECQHFTCQQSEHS